MTAEIAIMNKSAVALAADSAVTIETSDGKKIYNTVNKLFALSNCCPVGIMIYGNAQFVGIPWETIIKTFRSKFGRKKFNTLNKYSESFLAFLKNNKQLFPDSLLEKHFLIKVSNYFHYNIRVSIDEEVNSVIRGKKSIMVSEVERIVQEKILKEHEHWKGYPDLENRPKEFKDSLIKKHKTKLDTEIKEVFGKLPLRTLEFERLYDIATYLFVKDNFSSNHSGLVIAGFGEKNIFPSIECFKMEAQINGYIKLKRIVNKSIGENLSSSIIPFAQSEMVELFMEGVDRDYEKTIEQFLSETLKRYPELVSPILNEISEEKRKDLDGKLKEIGSKLAAEFAQGMGKFRRKKYVDPIIEIVSSLPKEDIAAMAETLVNLTSFKRKVSTSAETVGGPIDVAVISKGDGFIWMKRKHYFKPELNPHFFERFKGG